MIDSSFFFRPETMAVVWMLLFSSDWIMNCWGAKLYHGRTDRFWKFEQGYNLKSITAEELQHPWKLMFRFLSELLLTTVGLWLMLYTCKLFCSWKIYECLCGIFVILEACVHLRHMRNVALFSFAKKGSGLHGQIAIPRWITLNTAFVEFATLALFLLLIYIFDKNNFFALGGLIGCLLASMYNLLLAENAKKEMKAQEAKHA